MSYTPPIQTGIHLIETNGHFKLAITLKNTADSDILLRTMTGSLLDPSVKERTFTEDGTIHKWGAGGATTMAATSWTFDANSRYTARFTIPNEEMARERANELLNEHPNLYDDVLVDELVGGHDFQYINPSDAGVIRIVTNIPSTSSEYSIEVTRQMDLRTNRNRALDDTLPAVQTDTITNNMANTTSWNQKP